MIFTGQPGTPNAQPGAIWPGRPSTAATGGSSAATATASLSFGGSATESAPDTATGSLSINASASASAPPTTASASLALTGTGQAAASAPNTINVVNLQFSGLAGGVTPDTASASLGLLASSGQPAITANATASLSFSGAGTASFPATVGTGALTLTGAVQAAPVTPTVTAALSLSGSILTSSPATTSGALALTGATGQPVIRVTSVASLALASSTAPSSAPETATASVSLSATGQTPPIPAAATGGFSLAGSSGVSLPDTASGAINLTSSTQATGPSGASATIGLSSGLVQVSARDTALGSMAFSGAASTPPIPDAATAALSLAGSGLTRVPDTGSASLTLAGVGQSAGQVSPTGSLTFAASGTSTAALTPTSLLSLTGTAATGSVSPASSALLTLASTWHPSGVFAPATGSLALGGFASIPLPATAAASLAFSASLSAGVGATPAAFRVAFAPNSSTSNVSGLGFTVPTGTIATDTVIVASYTANTSTTGTYSTSGAGTLTQQAGLSARGGVRLYVGTGFVAGDNITINYGSATEAQIIGAVYIGQMEEFGATVVAITTTNSETLPSITTATDGAVIVSVYGTMSAAGVSVGSTTPTLSTRITQQASVGSFLVTNMTIADHSQTSQGATGTEVIGWTGNSTARWGVQLGIITPSTPTTAAGSLSFGGAGIASGIQASLGLGGSAAAQAPESAAGSLALSGAVPTPDTATGSLSFVSAANTVLITTIEDYSGGGFTAYSTGATPNTLPSVTSTAQSLKQYTARGAVGASGYAGVYTVPASSSVWCYRRYPVTGGTNQFALSWIFQVPSALPSGAKIFGVIPRNSTTPLYNMNLYSSGAIMVMDSVGTTLFTTTQVFATNTRYRVEAIVTVGTATNNGAITMDFYNDVTGVKINSSSYGSTTANFGTTALSTIDVGMPPGAAAGAMSILISNVRLAIGSNSQIGPVPAVETTYLYDYESGTPGDTVSTDVVSGSDGGIIGTPVYVTPGIHGHIGVSMVNNDSSGVSYINPNPNRGQATMYARVALDNGQRWIFSLGDQDSYYTYSGSAQAMLNLVIQAASSGATTLALYAPNAGSPSTQAMSRTFTIPGSPTTIDIRVDTVWSWDDLSAALTVQSQYFIGANIDGVTPDGVLLDVHTSSPTSSIPMNFQPTYSILGSSVSGPSWMGDSYRYSSKSDAFLPTPSFATPATATGSLSFVGFGSDSLTFPTAQASLGLGGTAATREPDTATGAFALSANVVPARAADTASASLGLGGAATARATSSGAAGSITLGDLNGYASVRTNLVNEPNFTRDTVGSPPSNWVNSGAAVTVENSVGPYTMKVQGAATFGVIIVYDGYFIPVTAGKMYQLSAWFLLPVAISNPLYLLGVNWFDASYTYMSTSIPPSPVSGPSGWSQATLPAIAPANAVYALVFTYPYAGLTPSEYYYSTDWLFEQSDTLQPYFDGDLPASGSTKYAWTGTPGLSTSTATTILEYVPVTSTGSLTLGGSSGVASPTASSGSMSLGGSAAATASPSPAASLSLGGGSTSGKASIGMAGALALSGLAGDTSSDSATSALSLTSVANLAGLVTTMATIAVAGTASGPFASESSSALLSLLGTFIGNTVTTSSANLDLEATGTALKGHGGTAVLSLVGAAAAAGSITPSALAFLVLAGAANLRGGATGATGSITYSATASPPGARTPGLGSMALVGTSTVRTTGTGSGSITFSTSIASQSPDAGTGALALTGVSWPSGDVDATSSFLMTVYASVAGAVISPTGSLDLDASGSDYVRFSRLVASLQMAGTGVSQGVPIQTRLWINNAWTPSLTFTRYADDWVSNE